MTHNHLPEINMYPKLMNRSAFIIEYFCIESHLCSPTCTKYSHYCEKTWLPDSLFAFSLKSIALFFNKEDHLYFCVPILSNIRLFHNMKISKVVKIFYAKVLNYNRYALVGRRITDRVILHLRISRPHNTSILN